MTVTAFDTISVANELGSEPNRWQDENTLTTSTSGNAYVESNGTFTGMRTLQLSTPDFMVDVPAGSEFVEMAVKFKAYVDALNSGDYFRFVTRQAGVDVREDDVDSTSTSLRTFSGDATYWGFTGDAKDILSDLADGTIKWWFETRGVVSVATRRDVEDFQVQLTYYEPATEGMLMAIIP